MSEGRRSCRRLVVLAARVTVAAACVAAPAAADEVEISRDALVAFEHYQTLEQPQFFVLSADGKRYGYSYCPGGLCPQRTPARQLALDACRDNAGHGCRIVAVGKQPDGTFSPFGKLTEDPLADDLFRIMREVVPQDRQSDEQLRSMIAAMMYLQYGALAYSAQRDAWGVAGEMENRPMAREMALQRCGAADCTIVVELGQEMPCIAYGSGSGSPLYATGKTDFSARKAVERQCAARAKGCVTIEATCSEGLVVR